MKLNLGCGRNLMPGWVNVDVMPPADLLTDLNAPQLGEENSVEEFRASHLIEHLHDPLAMMQECWRVAKPDARFCIWCPYGSSDDADEDPTHVRRMFLQSFDYFSQPYYWRADYGYRGDWRVHNIWLGCLRPLPTMHDIMTLRNQVVEMRIEMFAIKPARLPQRELQTRAKIMIVDA